MTSRRVFILGIVAFGLAGCGGDEKGDGTPKISYGKETCVRCGMLITEERHTAVIVEANSAELHFDDTGEMVATFQERAVADRTIWVHDFNSKEWIEGTQAYYVIDSQRKTPMATGVIAFGSKEEAIAFAGETTAPVLSWSELLTSWSIQ